jgi:hypothetical protein
MRRKSPVPAGTRIPVVQQQQSLYAAKERDVEQDVARYLISLASGAAQLLQVLSQQATAGRALCNQTKHWTLVCSLCNVRLKYDLCHCTRLLRVQAVSKTYLPTSSAISVCITGWTTGESVFDSQQKQRCFWGPLSLLSNGYRGSCH